MAALAQPAACIASKPHLPTDLTKLPGTQLEASELPHLIPEAHVPQVYLATSSCS